MPSVHRHTRDLVFPAGIHFVVGEIFVGRAVQLRERVTSDMVGGVGRDVLDELGNRTVCILGLKSGDM